MQHAGVLTTMRTGFSRTFWVANVIELFERFAYYASKAILAVFVAEQVGLGPEQAGFLVGSLFNTLLYFLPILAGTVVDRYGFRRSLMLCFAIFALGYFLIGLGGLPAGQPLVEALGARTYMVLALVVTAIGGSLIKPSIVGTVARTTTEQTKSLGYSIYYTLVNIGGAVGPLLALPVRENVGIAYVLVMSSAVSLLLLLAVVLFFKEPPRPADAKPVPSMGQVLADMVKVVANARFMAFLVIFSGFWAMFWQIFYSLPFYVRDVLGFSRFEIIETVDAWTIILVTVPVTALAMKLRPIVAMTLGFALATASWFVMGTFPTLTMTIVAIMIFAVGESLQSPRYYAYVADLAPQEQVGTYMGYAFLPIAIGTFVAGWIAGPLVSHYIGVRTDGVFVPSANFATAHHMWYWVGAIGVVSTLLMVTYDRFIAPRHERASAAGA
ncbi:MAG: MFS transporter [Vicinamibacteraceae bacterium]|nr:MFS transporter [Vicinamibacteraceae bacterium]